MNSADDIKEQYDRIYRYCYYKLQQKERAEDVTQETFLRYYGNDAYRVSEVPLKLLYTIAKNLCTDEYRRRQPEAELYGEPDLQGRDIAEQAVTGVWLREAVSRLDEAEQDILFLRFVNEEEFSVIAKLLGISRFAVYRRYKKALESLERSLDDRCG